MATLYLLDDDGAKAGRWDIGPRPLTVGRDQSASVVIGDEALSRRHFVISREGETYVLQDLGSQNGTWVGGERAQQQRTKLHHNVCIVAGRTLFLFSEHALSVGAPPVSRPATRGTDLVPPALAAPKASSLPGRQPNLS